MWPPDMPFADVMAAWAALVGDDFMRGLLVTLVGLAVVPRVGRVLRSFFH